MNQKPDLVLLHGWGMNQSVWQGVADLLAEHFTIHLLDLPGHGEQSSSAIGLTLQSWSDKVAECIPDNAYCVAWSLGGLLAIDLAARRPEKIRRLLVTAGTPRFVQSEGWQAAMPSTVFNQFAASLKQEIDGTMQRFLALQATGSEQAKVTLKQLKQFYAMMQPSLEALEVGLNLLKNTDVRDELKTLTMPVFFLNAQNDKLIPSELSEVLAEQYSNVTASIIEGCGHAPFINKPSVFVQQVRAFMCEE